MIIFHEGLPRSGKSYEAIVKQVLDYLKKGRQCFCFVDGIDFKKFHEVTGIPELQLKGRVVKTEISINEQSEHKYTIQEGNKLFALNYSGLLFQIEEEQVLTIYNHVADDSFVVLDELQDYWPVSTKPLDKDIRQFVTQHGHRGIDILVMGQAHEDCHNLWKRRIDQLITFEKRDAVGQPNNYTWRSHKQQKKGNRFIFVPIRSGKGTYDKKYFGLYKSHTTGVENTDNHTDDRVNVFKSKGFLFYVPLFIVVLVFAGNHIYGFFTPKDSKQSVSDSIPIKNNFNSSTNDLYQQRDVLMAQRQELLNKKDIEEKKELDRLKEYERTKNSQENYINTILSKYRPRLVGLIEGMRKGKIKVVATVQFLDDSYHVHESLNLVQLEELGWKYTRTSFGILLSSVDNSIVVTSWPLDLEGKVSDEVASRLHTREVSNEQYQNRSYYDGKTVYPY